MDIAPKLIIFFICFTFIVSRSWGLAAKSLAIVACAFLVVIVEDVITPDQTIKPIPTINLEGHRGSRGSDLGSRTDPTTMTPVDDVIKALTKHTEPWDQWRALELNLEALKTRLSPTLGEKVTLKYATHTDFSQAACINEASLGEFSLDAIPSEIWYYCSGPWNMDVVRKLYTLATEQNIYPTDFIDVSQIPAVRDGGLTEPEARQMLKDMLLKTRSYKPDWHDVFAFSRYVLFGEMFRIAGDTQHFKKSFDSRQQKKARVLSELYSPDDVVMYRKGVPFDQLISVVPEVHLVSTNLSNISIHDFVQSIVMFANLPKAYRTVFTDQPTNFVMVFSTDESVDALMLNISAISLLASAVQLESAGLSLARSFDDLLNSATWIFLGNDMRSDSHCGNISVPLGVAFYCEDTKSLYTPTLNESGGKSEVFKLVTAQLLHELYHAFLNPRSAKRSAFVGEIFATGRGEEMARTLLAAVANAVATDPDVLEERIERFGWALKQAATGVAVEASAFDKDMAVARQAIEEQPLTEEGQVQACRTKQYLRDPGWLSYRYILGLMSLSPSLWNELQTEVRQRAYAAAWAVGTFGRYGEELQLFEKADIKPLFDAADNVEFDDALLESSLTAVKVLARATVNDLPCEVR